MTEPEPGQTETRRNTEMEMDFRLLERHHPSCKRRKEKDAHRIKLLSAYLSSGQAANGHSSPTLDRSMASVSISDLK